MEKTVIPQMCGGTGEIIIERILGEKELNGKCGLYALHMPFRMHSKTGEVEHAFR